MYTAFVEDSNAQKLRIQDYERKNFGEALFTSALLFHYYCSRTSDNKDTKQLEYLQSMIDVDLCEYLQVYLNAIVSKKRDFLEEEYELFKHRRSTPLSPFVNSATYTEEDFIRDIQRMEEAWTKIKALRRVTRGIIELFKIVKIENVAWPNIDETLQAFEILDKTLDISAQRGAREARINIIYNE